MPKGKKIPADGNNRSMAYEGSFVKIVHESLVISQEQILIREIIVENEGVLIIVVDERDRIGLIRQKRGGGKYSYELPAGAINEGETALAAARRELEEETGLSAKEWALLSSQTNGAHSEGQNYYFLARGISKATGTAKADHDEKIKPIAFFPIDKALKLSLGDHMRDLRNKAGVWLSSVVLSRHS